MKAFSKVLLAFGIVSTLAVQKVCAQANSTGINNPNPSSNAALDIKNTPGIPQGILIPRMAEADTSKFDKSTFTKDEVGLMFYDNVNDAFLYWNGTKWNKLGSGGGSSLSTNSWGVKGNAGSDSAINFVGTTDNQALVLRTLNIDRIHIAQNGTVGIGMKPTGTHALEINGNIKTLGINETSDSRFKKDIKTLDNSLLNIQQLRGVSYNWRKDEFPDKNFESKEQIGLIAQEVEKIYPQLVDTDALGFKSVQYSKVVALLIEALKEQQMKINSLNIEVSKLSALEGKVNALTALVEILAKQNPVVETRK